ncbi:hypothetical protein [Caproiciproducens sp.]
MSGCCPNLDNVDIKKTIEHYEDIKRNLEKQVADHQREENRLRYMASGYAALIIKTNSPELIQRAKEMADEADKLN